MSNLPPDIENSRLWRDTLAEQPNDAFAAHRNRFRAVFLTFRERAGHLANEIRKDCAILTVHDLSHLDALWEIAATIVGEKYTLTPTEGFVLGGAILLHDLAMSVAAIEGGYKKIKQDVRWGDLVTYEYRSQFGRDPRPNELLEPVREAEEKAVFNLLRQIHAEKAEHLASLSFSASGTGVLFLIEDTEIRQIFGRLIGQVAHSHWWSLTEVEQRFSRPHGAPPWRGCPTEWTVDPLKIACILRTADAAHLDARRAPIFLRAISNLPPSSEVHWKFQEKLHKPYLNEDALTFTASAFRHEEASAWWLCFETLRMVDRELRSVDSLFADKGLPRFAARRVAGIESPERLASYVQADGWLPVNAMVQVTDLPMVIKSIGGEEMYGKRPATALRELIQNACDAVRARRLYEKRDATFGRISVLLTNPAQNEHWLEVIDTGIGMSRRVLTEFLLDFGRSFWGSPEMQEEFPGLLASGLHSTGKYGIGFFSVFMVAKHVVVITRRPDAAARDTLVLEFGSGLKGRPILRPANNDEQLLDGGTRVKLKLLVSPSATGGLLEKSSRAKSPTLGKLCAYLGPSIDVDLYVKDGSNEEKVVAANDWQEMEGKQLLQRMRFSSWTEEEPPEQSVVDFCTDAAANLRVIRHENGDIMGRALICDNHMYWKKPRPFDLQGVVTVGGLEANGISGIIGILVGRSCRASRDLAVPLVADSSLRTWANEQAQLIPRLCPAPEQQLRCAQIIRICGGQTGDLPVSSNQGRWVTANEIGRQADLPSEIILIDLFRLEFKTQDMGEYSLAANVFATELSSIPAILQHRARVFSRDEEWPRWENSSEYPEPFWARILGGAMLEAFAQAWGVCLADVVLHNNFENAEDLVVGKIADRDFILTGYRIRKPIGGKIHSAHSTVDKKSPTNAD